MPKMMHFRTLISEYYTEIMYSCENILGFIAENNTSFFRQSAMNMAIAMQWIPKNEHFL